MTAHRLEQLQALFSDSQWFKADEGQELLDEIERAWGEIETQQATIERVSERVIEVGKERDAALREVVDLRRAINEGIEITHDQAVKIERLTAELAARAPADAPSMREALTSICHGATLGLESAAMAEIARKALDASAPADASPEARADAARMAFVNADVGRGDTELTPWLAVVRTADATRPGLTEEQAQIARAEPIIAAWLDYFAAMDRQHKSGSAEDARIVRDLRAKAEAMYRGGPDIVYFVALARHRTSQGEAGALSSSQVRWKNGKLAPRGETNPAAEPFEKIEQLPTLGPGIGGAPIRVRPTAAPDPLALDPEDGTLCADCRAPRNTIHSALCSVRAGAKPGRAPDPRATLHAGDPASVPDASDLCAIAASYERAKQCPAVTNAKRGDK